MILSIPTLSEIVGQFKRKPKPKPMPLAPEDAVLADIESVPEPPAVPLADPMQVPETPTSTPAPQPAPQQERTTMSGFFLKIKTAFENLFKKSPTFIHYAIAFVTYAAPIVLGIEAFADPALVPPTQAVIARIQTGLATLYALAQEGTASGATLATTLAALKADLSSLEAVAGIKDAATIAKIATLLAEIQAIESLIPATPASPAVPAT